MKKKKKKTRKIYKVAEDVYRNRYQYSTEFDLLSLANRFDVPVNSLKYALKERYNFNFTNFRRLVLTAGALYLSDENYTQDLLCRKLNVGVRTCQRMLYQLNIKLPRGGDRYHLRKEKVTADG